MCRKNSAKHIFLKFTPILLHTQFEAYMYSTILHIYSTLMYIFLKILFKDTTQLYLTCTELYCIYMLNLTVYAFKY